MGVGEFLIWLGILTLIGYSLFNIFSMIKWCLKENSLKEESISREIAPNEFDTNDFEDV